MDSIKEKRSKFKIGLSAVKRQNLFSNGLNLNVVLWYDFFKNMGYDVVFIINDDFQHPGYKYTNFMRLVDTSKNVLKDDFDTNPDYYDITKIDVLIIVGLWSDILNSIATKLNIKIIHTLMGSTFHNDLHSMIHSSWGNTSVVEKISTELWISPHFEYCQQYYKIRYKTDNVFRGPYFWGDNLFKEYNLMNSVIKKFDKLDIAICEPNLEQSKNCIIPICICEKANKYINSVMCFSTFKLKENKFFKEFVTSTQLYKDKKISSEGRYALPLILSKYCNCIVSCVQDCDLNYLHLECFYLGIPLIHNSPMLKQYGYYYPKYDIEAGARQILNVLKTHDRDEYIKRHKPILEKYSIHNKMYQRWVDERLLNKDTNVRDID